MVNNDFESSRKPGGAHHLLSQLVGDWQGMTRTWFTPGVLSDESPMQGTIRPVLGGRFLLYEYEGAIGEEALHGMAIIGYHIYPGNYETAWIDDAHHGTSIMFSEGKGIPNGFQALGHYADPSGGPSWGWRTEIEVIDPEHISITVYNITPAGEEAKAIETIYTRR